MASLRSPLTPVANLALQFEGEVPARAAQAAAAGYSAVEFWRWEDVDLEALRAVCDLHGLSVELFVTDWTITVADPAQRDRLRSAVAGAIEAATVLDCPRLVITLGEVVEGQSEDERLAHIAEALTDVADLASAVGVQMFVEAVNDRVDHPGAAISTTAQARELVRRVNRPEVGLLFDVYHSVAQGEDAIGELHRSGDVVDYVQIADAPGRGEPGSGTIEWDDVVRAASEVGYTGPVGFEFAPRDGSIDAMSRARARWLDLCAPREMRP